MSIIPFFTLLVNCVVWSIYGLLIHEAPIYAYVYVYKTPILHSAMYMRATEQLRTMTVGWLNTPLC